MNVLLPATAEKVLREFEKRPESVRSDEKELGKCSGSATHGVPAWEA